MIEVRQVQSRRDKHRFLVFPWQINRGDPLWVPPLLKERKKATDPGRGHFFRGGYADFFLAYREATLAGTLCCSHEYGGDPRECTLGFFECIDDYAVAEALFQRAEDARMRERALLLLTQMDRETEEQGADAWVWKDPRLPLVLPFWTKFWGDVIYVIPIRNPIETILSGASMEGVPADALPLSAGFAYWQANMLNILSYTQSSQRKIFAAFDQLTGNPEAECERLCRFLDEQADRRPASTKEKIERLASQVHRSEHHFREERSLAELPQATREQRALYNFLRVKVLHPDEKFNEGDFAPYPGWREYLQAMDMLLSVRGQEENG